MFVVIVGLERGKGGKGAYYCVYVLEDLRWRDLAVLL